MPAYELFIVTSDEVTDDWKCSISNFLYYDEMGEMQKKKSCKGGQCGW